MLTAMHKQLSLENVPDVVGAFEVTKSEGAGSTDEYQLPTYWASYLINGDASGLNEDEERQINEWLEKNQPGHCVNVGEEHWFASRNDANWIGGDVAVFTFMRHGGNAEGSLWAIAKTITKNKVIPYVLVFFRGQQRLVPSGMRYDPDEIEAASRHGALIAWRAAMILKANREMSAEDISTELHRNTNDNTIPIGGITVPEEIIGERKLARPRPVAPPKDNPPRQRSIDEQLAQNRVMGEFKERITDPDPGSLDVAMDLLLQNGVKLSSLAHALALDGDSNNEKAKTRGWAGDFPSGNTGELVLSKATDPDDPDYVAVAWMVWKARKPWATSKFRSEIEITYRGSQWSENDKGPNFPTRGHSTHDSTIRIPPVSVFPVHERTEKYPPLGEFGGSTLEITERRTIDIAWNICRVLKQLHGAPAEQMLNAIHLMNKKKTPPALINPGSLKQNPPWVTHVLADAFESLSSQVPPQWLPELENVRGGPRGTLVAEIQEFGCGAYGCVLPTLDPAVVLKVTTDDTEADFASQLAADLVTPICVEYYMAVALSARHAGRPIFLLWRESADDVGNLAAVLGPEAEKLIDAQHVAAQAAYKALYEKQDARDLLRRWEHACGQMAAAGELGTLATGMLEVYRKQRVFFGDIHAGNLGRVFRGSERGQWVITDPGHVAVIGS
jgi:hypothetical protein